MDKQQRNIIPKAGSDSRSELINEADIIRSAKKRLENFRPLYEKYHRRILQYVLIKVNDHITANEITSNVFYKAMCNIGKYEIRKTSFYNWLVKIAFNESMIYFRTTKKEQWIYMDDSFYDTILIDDKSENKEDLINDLERSLQSLKPKEVELIGLRYYQKMSYEEVAFVLNISVNNAKVKMHRIMNKLRKEMVKS